MTETKPRRQQDDGYWGLCPHCRNTDGYINVGYDHWFFCDVHKTKWCIGWNLFSLAPFETDDFLRKQYEEKGFDDYEEVEPVYPTRAPDGSFVPEPERHGDGTPPTAHTFTRTTTMDARVCAQCGGGPSTDPTTDAPTIPIGGVWVHPECRRFWIKQHADVKDT